MNNSHMALHIQLHCRRDTEENHPITKEILTKKGFTEDFYNQLVILQKQLKRAYLTYHIKPVDKSLYKPSVPMQKGQIL